MNTRMIIIVTVVCLVAAAAYFTVRRGGVMPGPDAASLRRDSAQESSFGGSIYEEIAANPAEAMPNTNPFSAETNPFKEAYKNPFGAN